ncbi:MAG: hypothetical protein CMB31_06540 [Euryarchaeota archaeon]|nr:hypothetical protein [Euryarchaeota archaeon]|tara:strand:+ start:519 stop:1451 length:933 start_codon:yes stop_codon:yes gene_type:complete
MKYLVTGGVGFIGSNLVDKLLADGHEVVVVDNLISENSIARLKNGELSHWDDNQNLSLIKEDINSISDFSIFDNVDALFHLAALPNVQLSIDKPIEYHKANITGTLNMLYACNRAKIKRFIFSSSSAVYGEPKTLPSKEEAHLDYKSPYALHKVVGEQYCQLFTSLYGIETISLRYFNVYGKRQPMKGAYAPVMGIFSNQTLNNMPITINGDGKQYRDFVYVGDVVTANILSANIKFNNYDVFNIGSGIEFSINKVADLFDNKLPRKYKSPINEPRKSLADIRKARSVLQWKPKMQLIDWINDYKLKLGI